jgi:hypothetical protein
MGSGQIISYGPSFWWSAGGGLYTLSLLGSALDGVESSRGSEDSHKRWSNTSD